jgi:hypothetical protein
VARISWFPWKNPRRLMERNPFTLEGESFTLIRNLYRPPTTAQKKADIEYVASGGELKVAARLISDFTTTLRLGCSSRQLNIVRTLGSASKRTNLLH